MKDNYRKLRAGALTLQLAAMAFSGTAFAANPADVATYLANDRVVEVRELLAQKWNPNSTVKGQPAIMQAIREGAWRVYDVLAADPRTNVNVANSHDETPLMYLAIQGQTERARALIARGAQVNRLGWTPLHYAASKGQMDVAKLLLAHQAIVNAPGPDGTTPLMMAGLSGSEDMAELLLRAGADPSMRNTQGLDAGSWARSAKHEELAAKLDQAAAERLASLAARRAGKDPAVPDATPTERAPAGATTTVSPPASGQPASGGEAGSREVQGVEGIRLDPEGGARR
jgi:ankyrin repeat protein